MAKPESASGASRELIRAHRIWIIEIGRQLGLTTTQIAKQAGLVATTLTRLANDPEHKHALSSTTIDKIVRKFGVSPPITPDVAAFRGAVATAVAALHRQQALQLATPTLVASMVIELADWLMKTGEKGGEQVDAVVSFEIERLRARVPRETESLPDLHKSKP